MLFDILFGIWIFIMKDIIILNVFDIIIFFYKKINIF